MFNITLAEGGKMKPFRAETKRHSLSFAMQLAPKPLCLVSSSTQNLWRHWEIVVPVGLGQEKG